MPRGRARLPLGLAYTPAELRAQALRIRHHARDHVGDQAENKLTELADELDAKATSLEGARKKMANGS